MNKTLTSIGGFRAKCEKASFAATANSPYDDIMYRDIPKDLALSRLAVWGAIVDVHKAHNVLTDGQITTVIDASPAIVGLSGLAQLREVATHEQMGAFIESQSPTYGPGIMAAAQLWSLFHLASRTWPDHLFRDSVITDEGAALLGLTAMHLQAGDFTARDFKPRQFLMGMIAKSHKIADAAKSGQATNSPATVEDTAATFIGLVRDGNFEAVAASSLGRKFPDAECTVAMARQYKIPRKGGEVDFVRPDDVPSADEFARKVAAEAEPVAKFDAWDGGAEDEELEEEVQTGAVAGGDGAFLGYRSLTELKHKFIGSGGGRGALPTSVYMKRHPYGHATICKWQSQAMSAEAKGAVTADDVFAAALSGKAEFMEKYSPIFSPGLHDETLGGSGDGADAKKHRSIPSDSTFDIKHASIHLDLFAEVAPFRAARFADSNHFSNKRVMLLFEDSQALVRAPQSSVFKKMADQYRGFLSDGLTHEEAIDAAVAESKAAHPKEPDEAYHTWKMFLGKVYVESLDAKIGNDSLTDAHNMVAHDKLEEYSADTFSEVVDGVVSGEIEVHSAWADLGEQHTSAGDRAGGRIEKAFMEMHTVLVCNEHRDLAEALEKMSLLRLPTKEETAAICETLTEGHDTLKAGRELAKVFSNSVHVLSAALKSQITEASNQMVFDDGVKASVEAGVQEPDELKSRPPEARMAARMERVLKGAVAGK